MKKYDKIDHKAVRRIVSALTATVMIANMMPISEYSGVFKYLQLNVLQERNNSVLTAHAYNPTKNPDAFSAGTLHFSDANVSEFIDYCYYYSTRARLILSIKLFMKF
jgi:hypothetical protein